MYDICLCGKIFVTHSSQANTRLRDIICIDMEPEKLFNTSTSYKQYMKFIHTF